MSVVFALILAQADDLGERLMAGRWAAVEKADPKDKAALEALAKSEDKDLQWWAGAALAELDAREKAGPAWIEPLRVSIDEKGQPAHVVLAGLLAKAGARLGPEAWTGPDVTLSLKDMPLLRAIDEVCLQADVALQFSTTGVCTPQPGEVAKGPRFYHGTFAVAAVSTTRRTDVTFKDPPSSSLHVGLQLRSDPRLRVMEMPANWEIHRAVDDTGREIAPRARGAGVSLRYVSRSADGLGTELALDPPLRAAKKLTLLRGVVPVMLAKKVEPVVFEKVASGEPQSREIGGIKVLLKKCEQAGDRWTLSLEMTGSGTTRWPGTEEIVLEDASGTPLQNWGSSSSRSGGRATYDIHFRAEGQPAPARARFSVVTETYPRKIYFELKDVPLP